MQPFDIEACNQKLSDDVNHELQNINAYSGQAHTPRLLDLLRQSAVVSSIYTHKSSHFEELAKGVFTQQFQNAWTAAHTSSRRWQGFYRQAIESYDATIKEKDAKFVRYKKYMEAKVERYKDYLDAAKEDAQEEENAKESALQELTQKETEITRRGQRIELLERALRQEQSEKASLQTRLTAELAGKDAAMQQTQRLQAALQTTIEDNIAFRKATQRSLNSAFVHYCLIRENIEPLHDEHQEELNRIIETDSAFRCLEKEHPRLLNIRLQALALQEENEFLKRNPSQLLLDAARARNELQKVKEENEQLRARNRMLEKL